MATVENQQVRVRFAPSPTGPLHIGGVRTALYNYLFARQHGGTLILRIEDTDSQRFVPGAEEYIINSLRWCGITIDEGIGTAGVNTQSGAHAPYRQSERKEIYLQYALQLVASGKAYYAFDSAETLEELRKEYEGRGETFSYNAHTRQTLCNSFSLSAEEVAERIANGEQWVIRFMMPENVDVAMIDLIRGDISINTSTLDDKVLYKSADQLPTYHLANIVDDKLMGISHVIRGEEWLPSLPLHYLLYDALGWNDYRPQFAHLPLLLKPQGQGKLSKRDGDKLGFPVFPLQWVSSSDDISSGYRESGYLPEPFINMLALLGWNPGTEQEIFSMEQLVESFSLERVGKSGARFNPEKARWFNAQYLHAMSDKELAKLYLPHFREQGIEASEEKIAQAISLIKERATFGTELPSLTRYMFFSPDEYDEKSMKKFWNSENKNLLNSLLEYIKALDSFDNPAQEQEIKQWIYDSGFPMGKVMSLWRIAVIGNANGPNIYAISAFIGKENTLNRIEKLLSLA